MILNGVNNNCIFVSFYQVLPTTPGEILYYYRKEQESRGLILLDSNSKLLPINSQNLESIAKFFMLSGCITDATKINHSAIFAVTTDVIDEKFIEEIRNNLKCKVIFNNTKYDIDSLFDVNSIYFNKRNVICWNNSVTNTMQYIQDILYIRENLNKLLYNLKMFMKHQNQKDLIVHIETGMESVLSYQKIVGLTHMITCNVFDNEYIIPWENCIHQFASNDYGKYDWLSTNAIIKNYIPSDNAKDIIERTNQVNRILYDSILIWKHYLNKFACTPTWELDNTDKIKELASLLGVYPIIEAYKDGITVDELLW